MGITDLSPEQAELLRNHSKCEADVRVCSSGRIVACAAVAEVSGVCSSGRDVGCAAVAEVSGVGSSGRGVVCAAEVSGVCSSGRDRKSTRLNSSHSAKSRMPSSA